MAAQPINPRTNNPFRPQHLPPPTILPLRHCSHNDGDTPIDEVECLLSLLCPNQDTMRNKEHYILATAEPVALGHDDVNSDNPKKRRQAESLMEERNQKAAALRSGARSVPGVPIIYVKRSVMVLEPLSIPSEKVRLGVEKSKFKGGVEAALDIVSGIKRKREDEEEEETTAATTSRDRGLKKAKAPNPLSMRKPKKRVTQKPENQGKTSNKQKSRETRDDGSNVPDNAAEADADSSAKKKRKRKHKSAKSGTEAVDDSAHGQDQASDE
jgi:U3 small nucleolar RNA-associated protein 23